MRDNRIEWTKTNAFCLEIVMLLIIQNSQSHTLIQAISSCASCKHYVQLFISMCKICWIHVHTLCMSTIWALVLYLFFGVTFCSFLFLSLSFYFVISLILRSSDRTAKEREVTQNANHRGYSRKTLPRRRLCSLAHSHVYF